MDKAYLNALDISHTVAREEYQFVKNNLASTEQLTNGLKGQIDKVVDQGYRLLNQKDPSAQKLKSISQSLGQDLDCALQKHRQSVTLRAKQLEKFTVMLFGRTMAGKSTIREAITGGDGSTIGQGAQRTTRDIKEYEWQNLRVVDTPGFGAWGGKEDTEVAHSVVEESDLILFLLSSDSIQLSTVAEIKELSVKNKPVIFVLNVKQDLTKKIHKKRFLKDPNALFSNDKIGGHIQRLEELARDELGIRSNKLRIIPVHAQAAFLARQEQDPIASKTLLEASRLPALFELLSAEISTNGSVRRIQSLLDSAYSHLDYLDQHLIENRRQLNLYSNTVQEKYDQFNNWFQAYKKSIPELIDQKVERVFAQFERTIGSFVDENIERNDFDERWKRHLKNSGIESGLKKVMSTIQKDVQSKVEQFNKEVKQDIEFAKVLNFKDQNTYNPTDYKRLTGWGSAIAGGLATIAFLNSWNPVGWFCAAAAGIFSIFNWFSDSHESKLRSQKKKVASEIRKNVKEQKKKSKDDLLAWFNKNINDSINRCVLKDTKDLIFGIEQLCLSLEDGSTQCNKLLNSVNSRLIQRCALAVSNDPPPDIKNIVRIPGEGCFFTIHGYFRNTEMLKRIGISINEFVIVVYDGDIHKMVSHALGINIIKGSKVEVEGSMAKVYIPEKDMGRVIGRAGWRIKLVTSLLQIKIELVPTVRKENYKYA